jgi:hypothetical protein
MPERSNLTSRKCCPGERAEGRSPVTRMTNVSAALLTKRVTRSGGRGPAVAAGRGISPADIPGAYPSGRTILEWALVAGALTRPGRRATTYTMAEMTTRSLAACLLLVVASISIAGFAVDVSSDRAVSHHQWRARTRHDTLIRVSQRRALAAAADVPVPVLSALHQIAPTDRPGVQPVLAASVFVPPRA